MKYHTAFQEHVFRGLVDKAMVSVQQVLDINRNPRVLEDQDHVYDDKFALTEFIVNTSIAAQMNILERMGLSEDKLRSLFETVHQDKRSVTLCFEARDTCSFLEEKKVDVVQHDSEHVVETSEPGLFGVPTEKEKSVKHKVITKVTEYRWRVDVNWSIFAYAGNDPTKNVVHLQSRSSSTTIATTGTKQAPLPSSRFHDRMNIPLTWILQNMRLEKKQWTCGFKIDRSKETCRTPRRNDDTESAIEFFRSLPAWNDNVRAFFIRRIQSELSSLHEPAKPSEESTDYSLNAVNDSQVFCPVVPLMEECQETAGTATRQENPKSLLSLPGTQPGSTTPLLSLGDMDKLLNEHCRSLDEARALLNKTFPSDQLAKVVSVTEANLCLLSHASNSITKSFIQSVEYTENVLRKQLISAIGKEVSPKDFQEFMTFHCQKLFSPHYAPKPFCFAIRQPDHYPDGMISIESTRSDSDAAFEPCHTFVNHIPSATARPITIPLSAATEVQVTGDQYLHGWINHKFNNRSVGSHQLAARARQFSSFVLMIGVMGGPSKFVPKEAIIIQNKDEVLFPLLLNELPSAKEFKDAISSLSPEQQRFARAFRAMQLESTVFGLCVLQLKPQLEKLLGLPQDSLTKEIKLTQDLMSLFIDYQIPSDLLSFDGDAASTLQLKVDRVKKHVQSVLEVIDSSKKSILAESVDKAKMNVATQLQADEGLSAFGSPEHETMLQLACVGESLFHDNDEMSMKRKVSAVTRSAGPPGVMMMKEPGRGVVRSRRLARRVPLRSAHASRDRAAPEGYIQFMAKRAAPAPQQLAPPPRRDTSTNETPSPTTQSEPVQDQISEQNKGQGVDFTSIPKQLDSTFEEHDKDGAIHAATLKTQRPWKRMRAETILSKPKTTQLQDGDCRSEMNKAFDLLDALSRSGSLSIENSELHVVVAVTHCFENDVLGTVIQDNINPIEKVEKSLLMVASTIHQTKPLQMLNKADDRARLAGTFPALLRDEDTVS